MATTQDTNREAQSDKDVDDILDSIVETVLAARDHTE